MSAPSSSTLKSAGRSTKRDRPLARVAELIKSGKANNIVVLTGAGISTSAGIPDFRSPDTGLYANLEKLNLPFPEAVFELGYFKQNPVPFWTLAKDLYPGKYLPTPTHYFLTLLHTHAHLLRVFSQNIDTLETLAGLPSETIIEAHGSFAAAHCLSCKASASREYVLEAGVREGKVVHCQKKGCAGLVKPDIVFFGEGLPDRFFRHMSDLKKADLVIVIGTSLQVHPFAGLPEQCRPNVPRLLINREAVGPFRRAGGSGSKGKEKGSLTAILRQLGLKGDDVPAWAEDGEQSDEDGDQDDAEDGEDGEDGDDDESDERDMFWEGDADEGVRILADALGWGEELDEAVRRGHTDLQRRWTEQGLDPANADKGTGAGAPTSAQRDQVSAESERMAEQVARQVAARLSSSKGPSTGQNQEQESIPADGDSDSEDEEPHFGSAGGTRGGKIPQDEVEDMGRILSAQLKGGAKSPGADSKAVSQTVDT